MLPPQWIIEKKRDGEALSAPEIAGFVAGFTRGEIPDYQMAALAMAVYFQGMNADEVMALTAAMLDSGERIDTSSIPLPKSDKHSTGGIGDKVSLLLAPLAACFEIAVPMISGRGLGITGGTLDKLESIPGYRTDLSDAAMLEALRACGCSIIGQTGQLAPADKKLYALRDVTGTVPSIPLIVASILSKKLAEGLDSLVLDVKWGTGAFMRTEARARELARALVDVSTRMGTPAVAVVTDMNQPLGRTAGNALEVMETVAALSGEAAPDLLEVTLALGAQMLVLSGRAASPAEATPLLQAAMADGRALDRFRCMITAHGGDAAIMDHPDRLPRARIQEDFPAPRSGYVTRADAEAIGRACAVLGAGRARTIDPVDHAVGVSGLRKIGEKIRAGEPLATLHANAAEAADQARAFLDAAFDVAAEPPEAPALILDTIHPRSTPT
jgi:pyrimidine-nucleoside phosphorylase